MINSFFLFISLIFLSINMQAQETTTVDTVEVDSVVFIPVSFPEAVGTVNDFENLFTEKQIKALEKIIADFKAKSGNEIAIASITSIAPYEKFDQYALELSNYWSIGDAKKDNGLTIIFSKTLRQIRISTGIGTETKLTNEECKKIIDEYVIPEFKKGDFYNGVKAGLQQLIERWE